MSDQNLGPVNEHECHHRPCFDCGRGLTRVEYFVIRQLRAMRAELAERRSHCGTTAEPPEWAEQLLHGVHRLQKDMVMLMSDQAHLDADVQALVAGLDAVEQEIAALKNQPPAQALDFSALDAAVARLSSEVPAPPVPPTPPTDPVPPVPPVDTPPPTDPAPPTDQPPTGP